MSYPILEFDSGREAMIEPFKVISDRNAPAACVICFFQEVLDQVIETHSAIQLVENRWEDGPHPLYEIEHQGERLAFFHPGIGGLSASLLEDVIGFGCRQFIAVGGCGVLEKGIATGHLLVVEAAVRDEGVSYHYLPPSREVNTHAGTLEAIRGRLDREGVPYSMTKTWTTAAPYRETKAKIEQRRAEGCLAVEMEAASMMAVAEFRGMPYGQILYAGDDLSGEDWDNRGWQKRSDVRSSLFWLAADIALSLESEGGR